MKKEAVVENGLFLFSVPKDTKGGVVEFTVYDTKEQYEPVSPGPRRLEANGVKVEVEMVRYDERPTRAAVIRKLKLYAENVNRMGPGLASKPFAEAAEKLAASLPSPRKTARTQYREVFEPIEFWQYDPYCGVFQRYVCFQRRMIAETCASYSVNETDGEIQRLLQSVRDASK